MLFVPAQCGGTEINMTFKKKLENFWYYYKAHTIFALFTVLFIVISTVQCSKKIEYDMSFAHVGSSYIATEQIEQSLKKIVPDINGDGKVNIYFDSIIIPEKPASDSDFNMIDKLTITFVDGSTRIFIMEKDFFNVELYAEMFQPLEGIIDNKYLENGAKFKGKAIGISSMDCPFLTENNMADENLYVGILTVTPADKDKDKINGIYKASENILKEFIK